MISLRLAWKELRNHPGFTFFFILNIAAAFSGLFLVEALRGGLDRAVAERSKLMLSADVGVWTRREFTPAERTQIKNSLPEGAQTAEVVDFFTMLSNAGRTRLAEVRAVGDGYPFYAEIEANDGRSLHAADFALLQHRPEIWIDETLADQLAVTVGQEIHVGEQKFRVGAVIEKDSTNAFGRLLLAPRIYMHHAWVEETKLLKFGSLRTHRIFLSLPVSANVNEVRTRISEKLSDPGINVRTHKESSERSSRLFTVTSDYMSLVALTALFLACLGIVYQFRRFLLTRLKEIGILLALGASRRSTYAIFFWQLTFVSTAAAALSVFLVWLLFPYLEGAVIFLLPASTQFTLSIMDVLKLGPFGIVGAFVLCWPQIRTISKLSPTALFREEDASASSAKFPFLFYLPAIVIFGALSIWMTKSFMVSFVFLGCLFGSSLVLYLLARGVLFLVLHSRSIRFMPLRYAFRRLYRHSTATALSTVTLGLVTLLISLIPQVRFGLQEEFSLSNEDRPGLFLFDIQEEQLAALSEFAAERKAPLRQASPLIRARLQSVNGQPFGKVPEQEEFQTRESEREERSRNRGFNLTYRSDLAPSEKIVEGQAFSGVRDPDVAQVSVEVEFAKRLGWNLGDVLEFDIQGVPVKGRIVSFRSVRWMSFEPNFFVTFQPGYLDDTPKTYLAVTPPMPAEARGSFQSEMIQDFPNVSAIDPVNVIDRILELVEQMSTALQVTSICTLIAGLFSLWAMIRFDVYTRRHEENLLKVLGSRRLDIVLIGLIESGGLALISSVGGVLLSGLVAFGLLDRVFDAYPKLDVPIMGVTIGTVFVIGVALSLISSYRMWRSPPQRLL